MTSFSPNWKDMDLNHRIWETGWMDTESCSQWLYFQVEASDKWCPSLIRVRWKFLGLVHFNTFIRHRVRSREPSASLDMTQSWMKEKATEASDAIQKDLTAPGLRQQQTWAQAGRTHATQSYKGELRVLVDEKLGMRQKYVPTAQTWAAPKEDWPVGQGRWFFPSTLMRTHLECYTHIWGYQHKKERDLLSESREGPWRWREGWNWKIWDHSSWTREASGRPYSSFPVPKGHLQESRRGNFYKGM